MMTLDALRKELGKVNLTEVAALAGLSRLTASRIKNGGNSPNFDTFLRLQAALKGKATPPKERGEG